MLPYGSQKQKRCCSMDSAVDRIYQDYKTMKSYLESQNEISLLSNYTNTFRKVLVLSCGSYFEAQIVSILTEYAERCSSGDVRIKNFIYNQALAGKYHTLFAWGEQNEPTKPGKNANKFYALFGPEFSEYVKKDLAQPQTKFGTPKEEINSSIQSFLELGHLRNILVHSNFAEYSYDLKTPEEIYDLYRSEEHTSELQSQR